LEVMNGLPMMPLFVTFMITLPTLSTEPGPKMSGMASGFAPRRRLALCCMRAITSCSYSRSPWYSGSSGRRRAHDRNATSPSSPAAMRAQRAPHLNRLLILRRSFASPMSRYGPSERDAHAETHVAAFLEDARVVQGHPVQDVVAVRVLQVGPTGTA